MRLLIGIGFTFSLAVGVTLTLLTLCDGSGNTLTLTRTVFHWEWSAGAIIADSLTLFSWFCWRRLPPAKPTQLFPTLERWRQAPAVAVIFAVGGIVLVLGTAIDMGLWLLPHAAGASWIRLGF